MLITSALKERLYDKMIVGKKGMWRNWVEILAFFLLIIGFFLSLSAPSAFLSYIIVFLCGMVAGRLWYQQRKNLKFSWLMIIMGFLFGYVLGTYYGNRKIVVIMFLLGMILSYYVHDKKYIKSSEY